MFSHNSKFHQQWFITLILFFTFVLSTQAGPSFDEKLIDEVGWSVTLVDVVYNSEANTSTFTYELITSSDEKDLSHWVLAFDLDTVALVSVSPDNLTSYGLDPTTGVMGMKWDEGQAAGTTQYYSIVVQGQVDTVANDYSVKGGTYYAIGTTQGPGETIVNPETHYSISGLLFMDANNNGIYDNGEPLLNNVSVELFDSADNIIATVVTDENGQYEFISLVPGDYHVHVPHSTSVHDFNEVLFSYADIGHPSSLNVSVVDQDIINQDFTFVVNTQAILDDLNSDDSDGDGFSFPGVGKTIGYWKHQLSVAIKGKGRAHIDAATMMGYLTWIESFHLVKPFQFIDGDEFVHAHSIMAMRSSDAVDLLNKQLLGTELNHTSGMGLSGSYVELQHVILQWAEYISAHAMYFSREEILVAKDILDRINNLGH